MIYGYARVSRPPARTPRHRAHVSENPPVQASLGDRERRCRFHIHHHIPAWQYVIHATAFRRDRARCRDEAMRLLAFMGLAQRAHVQAGALSYGEQRMLEIARAPATAPRLLMVDEPAAGLNAGEVDMMLERIASLRRDGMTLCLVEHNMDLVMKVADRILVIDYGQYLFEGAPSEVQAHAGVIAAYLGAPMQDE